MDAYASAAVSQRPLREMGRGETAGWVRCPLCVARSRKTLQKKFARGRGLQMHLESAHADAGVQDHRRGLPLFFDRCTSSRAPEQHKRAAASAQKNDVHRPRRSRRRCCTRRDVCSRRGAL